MPACRETALHRSRRSRCRRCQAKVPSPSRQTSSRKPHRYRTCGCAFATMPATPAEALRVRAPNPPPHPPLFVLVLISSAGTAPHRPRHGSKLCASDDVTGSGGSGQRLSRTRCCRAEHLIDKLYIVAGVARIAEADCAPWAAAMRPTCLATLAGGTDCVVSVRADARVPPGCVAVDEVMQRNLHLCPGETYAFR